MYLCEYTYWEPYNWDGNIKKSFNIPFQNGLQTFHTLVEDEIAAYLKTIHPLDKAGAYAAQDDNGRLIAKVEGSMSNVIGLPMEKLGAFLASENYRRQK